MVLAAESGISKTTLRFDESVDSLTECSKAVVVTVYFSERVQTKKLAKRKGTQAKSRRKQMQDSSCPPCTNHVCLML